MNIEEQTIATIRNVSPAVVSVVMSKLMPKATANPFGSSFGPLGQLGIPLPEHELENSVDLGPNTPKEKVKVGGGSGCILTANGLILTNKHVVFDGDAEYTVITHDEKEYPAHVISRDPINDVAILKIEAKGLPTVSIGSSDDIQIGQTVIAIGNALGLFSNSVSKGIVSGLGRKIQASLGDEGEIEHLRNVIQTDVAINQGNSGGPLIDLTGNVVGINTAIIFGAQNIGFSIPINLAKRDIQDITKYGRIVRPYLGLRYIMLNKALKEKYDLPVDHGALVATDHIPGAVAILKGSPAHKAGVKENDIVLALNDTDINEKHDIADCIDDCKVGDKIELTLLRKGKELKVKTTLEERKV